MNPKRGEFLQIIAGPCALEDFNQAKEVADFCVKNNIKYMRAQVFKPRTRPQSFQGLGTKGIPILQYLKSRSLKLVCEVCSIDQYYLISDYADIIQIGARNMQNFELLKSLGDAIASKTMGPKILLKRGFGNTIDEWLGAASYFEARGISSKKIYYCERGTRNFASPSGVTLDLALAEYVRQETPYPVIIDPSHGTKDSRYVLPLTRAAMAMDFEGVMIEIHPRPKESVSDAHQAVSLEDFQVFINEVIPTHLKDKVVLFKDQSHGPSH